MQGVGVDVIKNGSERLTIVEKKVPEFDSMIQGSLSQQQGLIVQHEI